MAIPITGWTQAAVSNAPTMLQQMGRYATGGGNILTGVQMLAAGAIVGLGVALEQDLGGNGAETYEAEVYVNGSPTGLSVALGDHDLAFTAAGSVAFNSQDIISVWQKRTGGVTSNGGAEATVWITE